MSSLLDGVERRVRLLTFDRGNSTMVARRSDSPAGAQRVSESAQPAQEAWGAESSSRPAAVLGVSVVAGGLDAVRADCEAWGLSLIHISEPTRPY